MRWVVLILALGGAGGSGFLGYRWFTDTSDPLVRRLISPLEYESKRKASVFFAGGAVLGILGGLLALSRRGILAALVLLVAFAGPAVLAQEWLLQVTERIVGL